MGRVSKDFYRRDDAERGWMQENTWCHRCRLPDLGIDDPREFEEDGLVYVVGQCRICRDTLTTEIVDQRVSPAQA